MTPNTSDVLLAINDLLDSIKKLEDLGVIRSKNWVSDYGEWLVKCLYSAEIAESRTQKGWDVKLNGIKVQIKTNFIPDSGSKYSIFSTKHIFDELIIIGLSNNLKIAKMYRISLTDLVPISIQNKKEKHKYRINWSELKSSSVNPDTIQNIGEMADFFT